MRTITLTSLEVRLVKQAAIERHKHDRQNGAKATLYHEGDAIKAEENSYGGEVAFCKIFNLYPDMDTAHFATFDVCLPNGLTVDVKTTHRLGGRLIVKPTGHHADLYALMIGELPTYSFVGIAYAGDILQAHRLDRSLPFPAYAMNQAELQPIWRMA